MKNIFLIIVTSLLISFTTSGQSKSDKMYDVLSNQDGVTNFSFSKNMADAININLDDDSDERTVTGDLQQVRFMSYNPKKGKITGDEFTEEAIGYLPKSVYEKYENDEDEVDGAEIWLQGSRKKYSECHVFFQSAKENGIRLIVSFYGDFKVEDIDGLKKAGKNFSDD